jgi:hypothetical protein
LINAEHTILNETGGEFANSHQVRQNVVEKAENLIQEQLHDRSGRTASDFLIANEKG